MGSYISILIEIDARWLLELGQSTRKRVHRFPAGNWKNAVGIPLGKKNMKNCLQFPH